MKKHLSTFIIILIWNITYSQNATLINKSNSKLISNDIWSVSVDTNGNKWLGTSKDGLIKLKDTIFVNFNKNNSKIKGDFVSPIYSDTKGNVWVSFSKPKEKLAMYNGKEWIVFTEKEIPLPSVSVISITEDKNGNVYFGGSYGLVKYDGKKWERIKLPKKGIAIRAVDINENGDIAIGHNSGLLIRTNGKWKTFSENSKKLQLSVVRAVKYIDNKLFIGYGGGFGNGGFSIKEDKKWTHYNKSNSEISDHMIRDIEVDDKGNIWMATNNGLVKYTDGKVKSYMFRDGNYRNVIMDIAIENDVIWIATNFGLIKIE